MTWVTLSSKMDTMSLQAVVEKVASEPAAKKFFSQPHSVQSLYCPAGVRPALAAAAAQTEVSSGKFSPLPFSSVNTKKAAQAEAAKEKRRGLILYVTASGRAAEQVEAELAGYLPRVARFPSWETLPHERVSPRADTMAQRIAALRRLTHPEISGPGQTITILVAPVRALLQPVVAGLTEIEPLRILEGEDYPLDKLATRLLELGYEKTDLVSTRGQFAVRGGIVDVFVPGESHPQRLDFFGDTLEEVNYFSLSDQRSLEKSPAGVWAPACRELLLTDQVKQRASELQPSLPGVADMLELISQGIAVQGMESLAPVLASGLQSVVSLLPEDTTIVIDEPGRVARRAADLLATSHEFEQAAWQAAAGGGKIPIRAARALQSLNDFNQEALDKSHGWWELTGLPSADILDAENEEEPAAETVTLTEELSGGEEENGLSETTRPTYVYNGQTSMGARATKGYRGQIDQAVKELGQYLNAGWQVIVSCSGRGLASRFAANLSEAGLPARAVATLATSSDIEKGSVLVTAGKIAAGFTLKASHLLVLAEADLTGRSPRLAQAPRKLASRRGKTIVDPLSLKPGDYVVHSQHGVGRFVQMTKRTIGKGQDAVTREYLVLEYAPSRRGQAGDRLYVPTDSLDLVSRYAGSDTPQLNKMGGADWAKTKNRARKATREIAAELIRLYAARQATKGHAFGPDTPWQKELEDAFEYQETPDQLATIDEVKADMEKPSPMDRLLSGDVGFGKTEVAVRAAFKAIQEGFQVALLVPTTLLVKQHFETFSDRFAPFPVKIGQLSRFSTPAQARELKDQLRGGEIDLVIGTHSLITGEVGFKNLGLVIIDEEQRFGVEHKETLKALRTNVDVLSMSATPIPRTLEMAVTGIRELSTLSTPPEERHPVLTFVGAYQDKQVKAAIRRELLRDGQVFYVHNRVESIDRVAAHLSELVPEARIAVAHGKMHEKQLEQVMVDFWNHQADVLVCTTIVETGLDISNANTLIVSGAHRMGLSQLHQLRGRVGRGRERAYAYFFYPGDKPLTETAHERLQTIAANTDLGAGTAVAQKDLEIRGAGNLLGGQQSGHIAGVGFDLYIRMVSEAVRGFKEGAQAEADDSEVRIELPIDAHIPPEYMESERLRLEMYQKLSSVREEAQLEAVREEMTDRYGAPPANVQLLFTVAKLRMAARALGIKEIVAQGRFVRFAPISLADSQMLRIKRLHPGTVIKPAVRQILVPAPKGEKLGQSALHDEPLAQWVAKLLQNVLTPFGKVKTDAPE